MSTSEDDLHKLSDEEFNKLLDADDGEDEREYPEGEGKDDKDEAQDDASDDASDDEGAAADEATPPAADDKPAAEAEPEPAAPASRAPYTFEAPADTETRLAALKTEERNAFKLLMEGEMTAEDYQAIKDRTEAEADELKAAKISARISAEMAQQQAERDWIAACSAFAAKAKTNEGIDYEGNKILGRALDAEVKELAAKPENASKPAEWFLTEAHKAVKEAFGLKAAAPAPAPAASRPTRPPASAIPPSIAKLPAAAESMATENKWAYLDKMSGPQRERAIAAMSAQELDEYMDSEAR